MSETFQPIVTPDSKENNDKNLLVQPNPIYPTTSNPFLSPMISPLNFALHENLNLYSPMPLAVPTIGMNRTNGKHGLWKSITENFEEISTLQHICVSCGTTSTPLWRRNQEGAFECNACNLYYRKNHCPRPVNLSKKISKKRKRKDNNTTDTDLPEVQQEPQDEEEPPRRKRAPKFTPSNYSNINIPPIPLAPFPLWAYNPLMFPNFYPMMSAYPFIWPTQMPLLDGNCILNQNSDEIDRKQENEEEEEEEEIEVDVPKLGAKENRE